MPHPSHPPLLNHSSNTWRRVQIMKLFIIQFYELLNCIASFSLLRSLLQSTMSVTSADKADGKPSPISDAAPSTGILTHSPTDLTQEREQNHISRVRWYCADVSYGEKCWGGGGAPLCKSLTWHTRNIERMLRHREMHSTSRMRTSVHWRA
jgi:hypothetical protein